MLWHLGRKDLHSKFVRFAQRRGNIIHFHTPNEKPENGYEYLKFHIGGHKQDKMTRNELEELRTLVSRVLCVPSEFIVVAGIEATNSILVTFMIPEGYSIILLDLGDKDKKYLESKGVDAVLYKEHIINCKDIDITAADESISKDKELNMLLEQNSKLRTDFEGLQIITLKREKELRLAHTKYEELVRQFNEQRIAVTGALILQYVEAAYQPEKMSLRNLALQNALKYFNHALKKVEALGYDAPLIGYLLDANTIVNRYIKVNYQAFIQSQQQQMIGKLRQDITVLSYERNKLAYCLRVGICNPVLSENEEFFMKWLSFLPIRIGLPGLPIGKVDMRSLHIESVIMTEIFAMMESYLSEKEKEILVQTYLPSSKDTKAFKESKIPLLEYLWQNECKLKRPDEVDFHLWMINLLIAIKRMDLADIWAQKANNILQNLGTSMGQNVPQQTGTTSQEQTSSKPGRARRASGQHTEAKSTTVLAEEMNERLKRMEERLERNVKLTEQVVLGPIDPYRNVYPYGYSKLGQESQYDWSKIYQSQVFNKK